LNVFRLKTYGVFSSGYELVRLGTFWGLWGDVADQIDPFPGTSRRMWEKHQVSPLVFFETRQPEIKSSAAIISEHFATNMHFEAFWTLGYGRGMPDWEVFWATWARFRFHECAESTG